MAIFTLGYEGLTSALFFKILTQQSIEVLVDVREKPLSRKAGFSKSSLSAACDAQHIEYHHLRALGCPAEIRNSYRESGDWEVYTQQFLSHLNSQNVAVEQVAQWAQKQRICLVCFEADSNFCHRSFVADEVKNQIGLSVCHLNRNSIPSESLSGEADIPNQ